MPRGLEIWICVLLLVLAGCGTGDEGATDDERAATSVETTTTTSSTTTTLTIIVTTSTVAPTTTTTPLPPPTPAPTPPPTTAASGCHPSYSEACVPSGVSDVDCAGGSGDGPAYVTGPISVVGPDVYDLDRDGDGV